MWPHTLEKQQMEYALLTCQHLVQTPAAAAAAAAAMPAGALLQREAGAA
jgi:hypothetical protein